MCPRILLSLALILSLLASAQLAAQPPVEAWARVLALAPGTTILVTTTTSSNARRQFLRADDSTITLLTAGGAEQRIGKDQVVAIARPGSRKAKVLGAAIGAGGGFLIGFPVAVSLGQERECQPDCGGTIALMTAAALGLPVALGLIGYHIPKRTPETVIYRAP